MATSKSKLLRRRAESVGTLVIGAGQAGLAVSYYLTALGLEHLVLGRGEVAESWRSARWDSITLVTPNWMTRMPGHRLAPGTAARFDDRDGVIGTLERFAAGLPVRPNTEVRSLAATEGGYRVSTPEQDYAARTVVIAGRDVLLATSQVARVPRRYRGRDSHEWAVELGLYDQPAESVTTPAKFREPHPMLSGAHGGHTIALQQLARDGVRLLGRLVDAEHTKLTFDGALPDNMSYADQRAAGFRRIVDAHITRAGLVAEPPDEDPAERPLTRQPAPPDTLDTSAERIGSVIWCTGFGPDTAWIGVPVLRADGVPEHRRGVTAFPGLYVAGYPWLSTRGSGILYGVAADAERIAQHIAAARRERQP